MTTKGPSVPDPARRTALIAKLNDRFRTAEHRGLVHVSTGVMALGWQALLFVLESVREYDGFDAANDPAGEHAYGSFPVGHETVVWTIDYLDHDLAQPSPDPANQSVTTRMLVITLAGEGRAASASFLAGLASMAAVAGAIRPVPPRRPRP